MTTTDQNEPLFDLNDVNKAWSKLVSTYIINQITLEKQIEILKNDNDLLRAELIELQPLRATMSKEAGESATG